jgi:hypothetical protein
MIENFYKLAITDRRRMLADAGFVRNDLRIWMHADGRSIGESVAAALTDEAFNRFLRENVSDASGDHSGGELIDLGASRTA